MALLGVLGVGTWVALAAASFGTPSLAASPSASPTNSTTEPFTFSTSQAAGYLCSMATGANSTPAFTACASPKSYSGLAEGSYTFKVRAVDSKGGLSGIASYGWTVDLTPPPTPTITSKPASLSTTSSASFGFSDAESGVSYQCKLDAGSYAACSNPATFTVADGQHTLAVQAKDAAGNNSSGAASYSWTVDATPPPRPTVTSGPNQKWDSSTVTFAFTDSEAGVSYECSMDASAWSACVSPKAYYSMAAGTHEFDVRAVDAAGNRGDFNGWKWSENGSAGSGLPFAITGNTSGTLYPGGAAAPINLSLTNPNSVTIYISQLSVAIQAISAPNATTAHPCSPADFAIAQFSGGISTANPLALVPGGPRTLTQLGYTQSQLPTIRMLDTTKNQDGCKNATITFAYTGTAQS